MHNAGFDFEMPNINSINRCGCILTNDDDLEAFHLQKKDSLQHYNPPTRQNALEMCKRLLEEYPRLFADIQLIDIETLKTKEMICETCQRKGKNFACPPFSNRIDFNRWSFAVLWKWNPNETKKNRYNLALKIVHAAFFSMGFYFALSLRNCYCNECSPCTFSITDKSICNFRKMLAPSLQSQRIDTLPFGKGNFGIEFL